MTELASHEALLDDSVDYWKSILGDAQPTNATLPTPGCPNELAQVEKVAKALGTPLLPHQRYFIRVATEKNPDGSYKYRTVLLSLPRQSGKTTTVRALLTTRALLHKNRRAWLTAQTGMAARDLLFDLSDQITNSVFGKTVQVRKAADSPRITFGTRSRIGSFSPTVESLHSKTFADCLLDEIWAFDDKQAGDVMGAVLPAMQTKIDRQLIMVSTRGTPASTFLNSWIKRGKESLQNPDTSIAYFDWSLKDGLDAFDPDNWGFHPGLHGGLISKADIASAAETMSKSGFTRAYCNRQTETLDTVLNVQRWDKLKGTLTVPKRSQVAIAYEVSKDRKRSAIVAAFKDGKTTQLKVLRADTGVQWLPGALAEIYAANPLAIGADAYAQNQLIADELAADVPDIRLRMLKPADYKTACVSLKARIDDGTLTHDGHLGLRAAVATAESRTMGDGWCFRHGESPELIAATVAARLLDEQKAEVDPLITFFEDD